MYQYLIRMFMRSVDLSELLSTESLLENIQLFQSNHLGLQR